MRYRDYLDDSALRRYAAALNTRARAAMVAGKLDAADLRGVILDSGGRCSWCGTSVVDADFEVDHILSVTRGGPNTPENLALACPDCNRRKADKHPARYAAEMLARGGARDVFLTRVIALYGDPDPGTQLGLFDAPDSSASADESPDDDPPPYIW